MSWTHSLVFPIVLIGTIFTALDGAAQLQITSPANNSLAVEGSTITISVSADPSVQIVEVDGDTPLPAVQVGSGSGQFTLTIPTTIPA
jgi:hypothetical protein